MLRGTFRCTVGVGFSDCNNRSIPFACLLGVGAALFVCLFLMVGWEDFATGPTWMPGSFNNSLKGSTYTAAAF